jgi:hypothetical protein
MIFCLSDYFSHIGYIWFNHLPNHKGISRKNSSLMAAPAPTVDFC